MYNAELKEKFISEFSTGLSRREAARATFEAIEPYELGWNADICTRSSDEIKPVVEDIIGVRSSSKRLRLSILREYNRWCKKNNVEGVTDGILEVRETGVEKMRRSMVANPQHLQRFMDCIFDKESDETVDNISRSFYWLAYAGIKEEEVFNVLEKDVDFENMVIHFKNKEFPIYKEGIPALRNCVKLREFRVIHPNYPQGVYKDRIEGDNLLRGIKSNSLSTLRVTISKKNKVPRYRDQFDKDDKSLDIQTSYYKVWLSGLFYRVYEFERAGVPPDFMDVAADHMEGKTYNLSSGRNLIGAKQRQLAKDYLEDYNRWKGAFSI